MKHHVLKYAAALLLSVVATGLIGAPSTVEACSPPQEGIFVEQGVDFEQAVPVEGSWAVHVRTFNASVEELSVEVFDQTDELIAGTVSYIVEGESSFGGFGQSSEYLVTWTPTEELLPGHRYSVSIQAPYPYVPDTLQVDEQTTFTTIAYPTEMEDPANAEVAILSGASIRIDEQEGDFECCPDPYIGSCTSEICWATGYIYRPAIDLEVELPENDVDRQTYHRIETSSDASQFYWDNPTSISTSVYFGVDAPAPYCVTLKTFALATQELLDEVETCFEQSDLPDYTERELEGVTRPDVCEDDPDAGGQSDAGDGDATSPPDTRDEDVTTQQPDTRDSDTGTPNPEIGADIAGGGCGCTATPVSPASLLGVMLLLFAIGASRMSVFSPTR